MFKFLWLPVKLASCYLSIVLQYHKSSNFLKLPSRTLTNNKRHNFSCNEDNWTEYKVFGSWNNLLLLNTKVMLTSMYKCLVLVGQQLVANHSPGSAFNPLTPKIWSLTLTSSCYAFACKKVTRSWC